MEKNKLHKKRNREKGIQGFIFILGILVIILSGVVSGSYYKKKAETKERESLIRIADVSSAAINPRRLVDLKGNDEDLENLDYQRLKEQLALIDGSLKAFDAKWIYLMEKKEGMWVFSVDPLNESSPDYTPPGTPYDDYPKELDQIFEKKNTMVIGPYSDQWGDFVSAFSPVKDFESGEILGVLGVDIDASTWISNIWKSQIISATISFFLLALWILFFIYRRNKFKHEKEIKSRERYFKSIAESMKDVIYRLDLEGKVVYSSPAISSILGFSQEESIGKNFLEFVPSSERSKAEDAFKKLSLGKKIDSLEILVKRKNGEPIQADLNISPIQEDGEVFEIQGVIRDVTERKKSEAWVNNQNEELKKSHTAILNILEDIEEEKENVSKEKDKIDAILHSIGDGVFVVDRNSKIIMVNNVTAQISGYPQKDMIGKNYDETLKFIFEKDESKNEEFIKEAIRTGEVKEMSNHTLLIRKDGSRVPVADSAAPLKNKKGEVIGCVVVFRDVTKEREIDRMKSEFVSVASHQLRTPLTGIKWFSELLLENKKKLTKEQKEFVTEIYESNQRMISLVNDLLNVSRIETGTNFEVEKKETDIVSVIMGIIKEQEIIAKQKGIKIICDKNCPEKIILSIDGDKIRQVFQNLVNNAIKYSPKSSSIFLSHKEEEGKVIFSVKDSGVGIPLDQQGKIFEKFFRAGNVLMTEAEGTGLGLYIAKSIIEAHGGKIWFESEENKGTTFYVELPK